MTVRAAIVLSAGAVVLATSACGGGRSDQSAQPELTDNLRYDACVARVPVHTDEASARQFSRRELVRAVGGRGPHLLTSQRRPGDTGSVDRPFRLPEQLWRDLAQGGSDRDGETVTVASHRVSARTFAGWLRCAKYRPVIQDRGPGTLWRPPRDPVPRTAFVRTVPGLAIGGPPREVQRATANLFVRSHIPALDRATQAAIASGSGFVGARTGREACAVGRWGETTMHKRARLHFLLNAHAAAAKTLRLSHYNVLHSVRTPRELRVDVRAAIPSETIQKFIGMYEPDIRSSDLSC